MEGALRGGVDVVQIREKSLIDEALLEHTRNVVRQVDGRALVMLNDAADLIDAADVDGLHVGQEDLAGGEARERVGPNRLLGISTHDDREIALARPFADYLGFGAIFRSSTRSDVIARGPAEAAHAQELAGSDLPVFAIGGIDASKIDDLVRVGIRRVAVCQAILGAEDAEGAARELGERLRGQG